MANGIAAPPDLRAQKCCDPDAQLQGWTRPAAPVTSRGSTARAGRPAGAVAVGPRPAGARAWVRRAEAGGRESSRMKRTRVSLTNRSSATSSAGRGAARACWASRRASASARRPAATTRLAGLMVALAYIAWRWRDTGQASVWTSSSRAILNCGISSSRGTNLAGTLGRQAIRACLRDDEGGGAREADRSLARLSGDAARCRRSSCRRGVGHCRRWRLRRSSASPGGAAPRQHIPRLRRCD